MIGRVEKDDPMPIVMTRPTSAQWNSDLPLSAAKQRPEPLKLIRKLKSVKKLAKPVCAEIGRLLNLLLEVILQRPAKAGRWHRQSQSRSERSILNIN